ncbi:P-loop NTPase fold protein [Streptomyces sp. NPDC014733]|uniref:P-loop NTPase fold protein n=1 Tax=Streptomyces sp. NPDC014733 TaxID=3364885 RepID=UPI0036FB4B8D
MSDEPVTEAGGDLLGAQAAARRLAGLLVASRPATPFTLAVDAGWGMGKSSLMRLVDAELTAQSDVHTVWYNAWTSTGSDALEGLIKSVLMRFDRRVLRRGLQRATEQRALLRVVRAVTTVAAGPLGVAGLVDELWKNLSVNSQARNEMRTAIGELVGEWAQNAGELRRMLVVFIDDLDRCSEETVLAVCEAVKVYLDVPGLAFVVGCDRSAMGPNGLLRDLSPAGSAFMEKIFQTSYRIPAPDGRGVEEYIRWCARTAGVAPLVDDALVELLAQRSARNPRRIKRLVNGFVLEATLNPVWRDFGPDAVLRTLLLQYFYPDFYRMMTGPSGTVDGDVVAEFRTYRAVRRTLLAPRGSVPEEETEAAARFVARYDLVVPEGPDAAGPDVLAALERQLPREFPELVLNSGFTSLIDELVDLDDAARLLVRLREGPSLSGDGPARMSAAWEPLREVLDGMRDDLDADGSPLAWPVPVPEGRADGIPEQGAGYPELPPEFRTGARPEPFRPGAAVYGDAAYGDSVHMNGGAGPELPEQGASDGRGQRFVAGAARYGSRGGYALPTLDVLWVDDQPYRKGEVRAVLRSLGARVRHVTSSGEAAAELRSRPPGLLISDISRRRNHTAGFTMVERFRREYLYDGPVIFYTIRQSPEREDRAASLGARLTNQEDRLRELVVEAMEARGRSATGPRQPAAEPYPVVGAEVPAPGAGPRLPAAPVADPVPAPSREFPAPRPRTGPSIPLEGPPPDDGPDLDLAVLWVDDAPEGLTSMVAELRRRGADIQVVTTDDEVLARVAARPVDLLLSDVTRDGDPDAGFALARRLRDEGLYDGPIGFFAGRVTEERERRAREVGALGLSLQAGTLVEWIEEVQRERRGAGDTE